MEQGVEHLDMAFDEVELPERIGGLSSGELDLMEFGGIGFDAEGRGREYNRYGSTGAEVAPCMGNAMVAGRFARAAADAEPLDATLDYVLTLRMRPARVRIRLLADPGAPLQYLRMPRLP